MNNLVLLKNEIKTLLKQKNVIASIFLMNVFMVFGINSINNSNEMMMHEIKKTSTTISFGSAQYGITLGALLFCILTVLTLSKDQRKNTIDIIHSSINYFKLNVIRMISIISISLITVLSGLIIVLGIQNFIFNIPIEFSIYAYTYTIILLIPLALSIVISSGLYMITDSIDISLLSMGILYSIGVFSSNYLLLWVKPAIPVFSDFAGIKPAGKLIEYNRLLWICIAIFILLLGLLCRRRYTLTLFRSLKINMKSNIIPLLLFISILGISFIWVKEPYMNKYNSIIADNEEIISKVMLEEINPQVVFYADKGKMEANVNYKFHNNSKADYIKFSINEGLDIKDVKVNGKTENYKRKNSTNIIYINIPKEKNISIDISYSGNIKYDGAMGYAGYICNDSIYLLENSNWIFRPLTETKKMITSTGYFKAPDNLSLVTPGKLTEVTKEKGYKKWNYTLEAPSMDLAVFAGKYVKKELSLGNTPIEFYYSPRHEEYIKHRNIEDYLIDIFAFYEKNFGAYPSDKYPLKIVETSIYKPGGHSSINIVTFAEYILNRELGKKANDDIDIFRKSDFTFLHDINLIAHEISHQWWGTSVEPVGDMPWSSEGLANYSSCKYMENKFGEKESSYFLFSWNSNVNKLNNNYYIKNPREKKKLSKFYAKQLELEYKKMQAYHKMPIMLLAAEERIGEDKFLSNLSKIYYSHRFGKLTYENFLNEMDLTEEAMNFE
ncbi:M1 family aminopeptidase [Maledivibacter halophilus]|uniref:Aminopeptidase N n=1 Tax=Maledivibacter halophilus TaxID=36842 RepID=A0A1T5MJ68_9FIRM|nr:M1 family aminopeptidase [Maledivibacter halophilus]SKC88281.1 Aminopeptidase N [Maledivibacter halophilus]